MKISNNWARFTIALNRALAAKRAELAVEALKLIENEKLHTLQQQMINLVKKAIDKKYFEWSEDFKNKLFAIWRKFDKLPDVQPVAFDVPAPKFSSQLTGNFK